ncbi:hypothetical protein TNCV_1348021 [Trichonephila clavipes]|nr:hypothetical protein TNCV_1348021 [Trichonephila clavipes]
MAPKDRRLGCVLACYAPIGRGRSRDRGDPKGEVGRGGQESPGERTDGKERKETERDGKRVRERERTEGGGETEKRERGDGKRVGERESEARLEWRKRLSPEIGVKKTMNAGGVENGNMN